MNLTIGKISPQGPEEVDSEKFWDERDGEPSIWRCRMPAGYIRTENSSKTCVSQIGARLASESSRTGR